MLLTYPDDAVDRDQCGEAADRPGQSAKNAELRAIVAVFRVKCIADETAIAWPSLEQSDLALELHGRRGKQRNAERDAGVADSETGRKIIAAVNDKVMPRKELLRIVLINPQLHRNGFDEVIQAVGELYGEIGLGVSRVPFPKQRLTMQIGDLDHVPVDDRQMPYPCPGERRNDRTADPSSADYRNFRALELALADAPHLRQNDVPSVSVKLFVR